MDPSSVWQSPNHLFDRRTSARRRGVGGGGPPSGVLTEEDRAALIERHGQANVQAMETQARALFDTIDTVHDGTLDLAEFAKALGVLGARSGADEGGLASFMFHAVDVDGSGRIGFREFLEWNLIMVCGSRDERLRFGFNICDFNHDGVVDRTELRTLIESMFSVLSGLTLDAHNPDIDEFVDRLFIGFDGDGDSKLTWEEYRQACDQMGDQMTHLGATDALVRSVSREVESNARQQEAQKALGSRLFFGQEKWEFMLTLMLGLQIAVEESKKDLDRVVHRRLSRSWSEDALNKSESEPIPEYTYPIPSAGDSRQQDNARKCGELVLGISTNDDVPASELLLDEFIAAAKDEERGDALARALVLRLHDPPPTVALKVIRAIRSIGNDATDGRLPAAVMARFESAGVLREAQNLQMSEKWQMEPAVRQAACGLCDLMYHSSATAAVAESHNSRRLRERAKSIAAGVRDAVVDVADAALHDVAEPANGSGEADAAPLLAPCSSSGMASASITVIGPILFREIRESFGISSQVFLASLGVRQVIGGLLMGDLRGMSSMVSEGKSGSLFYWSHDGRFMVKTIGADERGSLIAMLRSYRNYVTSHKDTLLTKYLGLYDLRVPAGGGNGCKVFHLVIMSNVFNTPLEVHERFDLKGSTHNRTVGEEQRGTLGLVHKDLDFSDMNRTVGLPHHVAESLRNQITQDANFLAGHGIIDYSLLIGIHNGGSERPYSSVLSPPTSSASRPPATPRTPGADSEMNASPVANSAPAAAVDAAGDAASSREQRVQALATLQSGLAGLGLQSSPEQRQRAEQKDRWVSKHIDELERKYQLLTDNAVGGVEAADAMLKKNQHSVSLRRERSSPQEIQRKQMELMEQLEHDPDNEALLEQVKSLHSELVITVSEGPEPEPESEQQQLDSEAAVCDMLSWADFVDLAFAHSSSGALTAVTSGVAENRGGQQNDGDTSGVENGYPDGGSSCGVGATFSPRESSPPVSLFAQHKGGMQAMTYRPGLEPMSLTVQRQSSDVVFLGIIDTLVPFKLRKKAEHVGKSIFQHGKNFSVIPPEDFKERFINTMNADVISSMPAVGGRTINGMVEHDQFVV